jgi:Flp pilus assembly pilin Flp
VGSAHRTRGQGLVEYGLILGLTASLSALILTVFGGALADILASLAGIIDAATGGG